MTRKKRILAGAVRGGGFRLQSGVTLYELLFVVVLTGLIATIMMPSKGPGEALKLDLAAMEIVDALRFARSEALRTGEPRGARLDNKAMQIRVFRMDRRTVPATARFDVYHPVDKNIYDRKLAGMPFDFTGKMDVVPSANGKCIAIEDFFFDANGIPWCEDSRDVPLEKLVVTLSLGNDLRNVVVQGINGRVAIR